MMKNQNKECNGALYSGDGKVFLKLLNQECCYYAVENGTESISDNAFATLSFSNKTEFLDLPDSVTKLGSGAFQRMALNSIAIPPKVTEIPEKLLFGCTNLEHVHLPEGVECINREAFWKCPNLTRITLPHSLKEIIGNPFAYSGIREIDNLSEYFKIQDECLYTADGTLIFNFSNKREFDVPFWVMEIGGSAFEGNVYMEKISFPRLIKIAPRAFANCTSLTTISVPQKTKHRFNVGKNNYKLIKERNDENIRSTLGVMDIFSVSLKGPNLIPESSTNYNAG